MVVAQIASILLNGGWLPIIVSPRDGPMGDVLRRSGAAVIVDPWEPVRSTLLQRLAQRATVAVCNTIDTAAAALVVAPHTPTLLYVHEVSLLKQRIDEPVVRAAVTAVEMVWAGSPMCQSLLLPVRPNAIVVPYGLEPLADGPEHVSFGIFKVGVFGSVEARKGQDLAIAGYAALSAADRSRLELNLFGRSLDPSFAAKVTASAAEHGVRLLGELDRDAYIAAMQAMDAVLISSRDDTLPLVSIDALGLGKMLLLMPSVGTSAWLEDGRNVMIASETTSHGVTQLLERALRCRNDAPRFRQAAQQAHRQHFSLSAFRNRLMSTIIAMGTR